MPVLPRFLMPAGAVSLENAMIDLPFCCVAKRAPSGEPGRSLLTVPAPRNGERPYSQWKYIPI
jgi:hypothetical protein